MALNTDRRRIIHVAIQNGEHVSDAADLGHGFHATALYCVAPTDEGKFLGFEAAVLNAGHPSNSGEPATRVLRQLDQAEKLYVVEWVEGWHPLHGELFKSFGRIRVVSLSKDNGTPAPQSAGATFVLVAMPCPPNYPG